MATDAAMLAKRKCSSESKREKAKRLRIAGQSYVNSKGQCVPEKCIGPDCNCRLECFKKINEVKRQRIFKEFYDLKSYDEQGSYLYGLIKKQDVKRKRALLSDGKFSTYKYHIRCNGSFVQVCKTAFANIHAISFKKIRNLCEKIDHDVLYPHDQRGKHSNRPSRIPNEIVDCIKNFMLSVLQSDQIVEFIREDKSHRCEINVSQLYRQYMKVHEPGAFDINGKFDANYTRRVKTWFFKKVFDEEIVVDNAKLKQIKTMAGSTGKSESKAIPKTNASTSATQSLPVITNSLPADQSIKKQHTLPKLLASYKGDSIEIFPI